MRLNTVVMGGFFVGLLAGAVPAAAQIGIGVIGGVSFTDIYGADKDSLLVDVAPDVRRSGSTGFLVGAMLDFPLGIVSIRPEVLYVQKGVKFSAANGAAEFDLDYIEIPLLLVVGIPAGGLKVEFFAGPQVSFQTKCEVTGGATADPVETFACDDPGSFVGEMEIESKDFGVLFGGGVAVGNFMAQVALDYSLMTLDAEDDPYDVKNQAIYALVGWMFRLN